MMLKIALREYFKAHADLLDRMVAAYVIGFSITQEDLDENPALKFAEGADDTGVIVSWNTEGPENKDADSAVVTAGAMAINPISWTRDDAYYYSIRENVKTRIDHYWKLSEADRQIVNTFIDEFQLIAAVPRPTKHEKAVSDFLRGWAEERGYAVKQNEVYDLIFDVPATEGYEALPLTALQAHMDMVCIGADGVDYDPQSDPITVQFDLDKGIMTADGTSLGADDGAGVAMIMAIVDGGMDHGPLRVIFTVDEEVDMTGAMAITAEDLDGVRYLVNIDSEESDTVTISTAADATIIATETPSMASASGDAALRIKLSGLKGGHSGIEIGDGRCNGIIAVGKTLAQLKESVPFGLVSFAGGRADNAIPDGAEAVIVVASEDREAVRAFIADREGELQNEYRGIEDSISLSVSGGIVGLPGLTG